MEKNKIWTKQRDKNECAVACLNSIFRFYNLRLSYYKIKDDLNTDLRGNSIWSIVNVAKKYKFISKGVKSENKESLFSDINYPVIANVITEFQDLHYIVILSINNNWMEIFDPAVGKKNILIDEFIEMWTGYLVLIYPSDEFVAYRDEESTLKKIFSIINIPKRNWLYVTIISLLVTTLSIISSYYFSFLIDKVIPKDSSKFLYSFMIIIGILYFLKSIMGKIRGKIILLIEKKMNTELILNFFCSLIRLPLSFFSKKDSGDIVSRLKDVAKIKDAISNIAVTAILDCVMLIVILFVLLFLSEFSFLIAFITIILYVILTYFFAPILKKYSNEGAKKEADFMSYIINSINGIETIKNYNMQEKIEMYSAQKFENCINIAYNAGKINLVQSFLKEMIEAFVFIVYAYFGVQGVYNGSISCGELVTYNVLLMLILEPLERILSMQNFIQPALVSVDRMFEILREKKELDEGKRILKSFNRISYKEVCFSYGLRDATLDNINLEVKKGQKIAIIGESGSGKSTMVKLLMRFYDYTSGKIEIDGYELSEFTLESLRLNISYVSQNIFFFKGTILENLEISCGLSKKEVIEKVEKIGFSSFIEKFPLGINTVIEENGVNLSQGQKQRLSIIRALINNPQVLIIDEAVSSLDVITQNKVLDDIFQYDFNMTIIIITHNLNIVHKCNSVCIVDDGRIVEYGEVNKLLSNKSRLVEMLSYEQQHNNRGD